MKVIVAHPFQQHSFRTAIAVKKKNDLYKYVTTVYLKKRSITYNLIKFLSGENLQRAKGRKCESLDDNDVTLLAEWANLILLFLQRVDKTTKLYYWWYKKTIIIFNNKLFNYIKKNEIDVIITYDTLSAGLIRKIRREQLSVKIVIDMSAPNANYMKEKFEEAAQKVPGQYIQDLEKKNDSYFQSKCEAAEIELKEADAFLAASDFTKTSLLWSGVAEEKIFKCIYGIKESNLSDFMALKSVEKIKCCFLGKVCLQKGAYTLFSIIDRLKDSKYEFHFYGAYSKNTQYYSKYKNTCIFHGHIPHEEMLKELEFTDILIFPSFSDGFGFSVAEALNRNNIVLCSKNAGSSELIIDDKNGYIFNPDDEDSLYSILSEIKIEKLRKMQEYAPKSIEKYTWENYERNIAIALESIYKQSK